MIIKGKQQDKYAPPRLALAMLVTPRMVPKLSGLMGGGWIEYLPVEYVHSWIGLDLVYYEEVLPTPKSNITVVECQTLIVAIHGIGSYSIQQR